MENEVKHAGVLGMRWGRRKGPSASGSKSGGTRKFKAESLTKNMDGRKVNKLLGKRNVAAAKKNVTNFLMTPAASKTKWTDMKDSEKAGAVVMSALAVVGAIAIAKYSSHF